MNQSPSSDVWKSVNSNSSNGVIKKSDQFLFRPEKEPIYTPGMSAQPLPLPLQTARLTLRLPRPEDAEDLLAYYSRADVARYLLEEPWTPDYAREQLGKRVARTGLDSETRALALVWEQAGRVIGDLGLWLTDQRGEVAEVGWVMHPDYSGRGMATEAVRPVLDAAFEVYGVHRITAQMDARNVASARLCERLGMQREAHLRQDCWSKGEWTDTLIYGMLAADRAKT